MRKARARTAARVIMANRSWRAVDPTIFTNCTMGIPRIKADPNAANKQDVPAADKRFNVNTAAYGVGLPTAGGTRRTRLCRPTQFKFQVALFSQTLTASKPQSDTKMTSRTYGDHA